MPYVALIVNLTTVLVAVARDAEGSVWDVTVVDGDGNPAHSMGIWRCDQYTVKARMRTWKEWSL